MQLFWSLKTSGDDTPKAINNNYYTPALLPGLSQAFKSRILGEKRYPDIPGLMEPLRHHRNPRKPDCADNPPSAEDYYRGVMPDGSPLPSLSAFLIDPYDHEIPGAPDKHKQTLDEIERALDMQLLRDYDSVLDGLRKLKAFCDERLEDEFEAERVAAQQALVVPTADV